MPDSDRSAVSTLTAEELRAYHGQEGGPIYLALDGIVYDVTTNRTVYGPRGRLAHWAGQDVTSRIVDQGLTARYSRLNPAHNQSDIEALATERAEQLAGSRDAYQKKYPVVGNLVSSSASSGSSTELGGQRSSQKSESKVSQLPDTSITGAATTTASYDTVERNYLAYVELLSKVVPRLRPVLHFLENQQSHDDCVTCHGMAGTLISFDENGASSIKYKTSTNSAVDPQALRSAITAALQEPYSRRHVLVCEDIQPNAAKFLASILGLDPVVLAHYVNRDASFEAGAMESYAFDYPETYHSDDIPRFQTEVEFLLSQRHARPCTMLRVWKSYYALFQRIVWAVVPSESGFVHIIFVDSLRGPLRPSVTHLPSSYLSFHQYDPSMEGFSPLRSCREQLEDALLRVQFRKESTAPANLELELQAAEGIRGAITKILYSKWELMIRCAQESISESIAPLSGELDQIEEVIRRKHDFEKLERSLATLESSIKQIPGVTDPSDELCALQVYKSRLESWAVQLEKVSQSLLGMLAVAESIKATQQSIRSQNLQLLAFVFIPISTISSIYGMNTQEILNSPPHNWYFVVGSAIAIAGFTLVATFYPTTPAPWFIGPISKDPYAFVVDIVLLVLAFILKTVVGLIGVIVFVIVAILYLPVSIVLAILPAVLCGILKLVPIRELQRTGENPDWLSETNAYLTTLILIPFWPLVLLLEPEGYIRYKIIRAWELLYYYDIRYPLTISGKQKQRRRWAWTRRNPALVTSKNTKPRDETECLIM